MPSAHREARAIAEIPCPRCQAPAGEECRVMRERPGARVCKERVKANQTRDHSAEIAQTAAAEAQLIATTACQRCGAKAGERCTIAASRRTCKERGNAETFREELARLRS